MDSARDQKTDYQPCAANLKGEYGINDLFIEVPLKVGLGGLEKIIEIKLTEVENAAPEKSAAAVKDIVVLVENIA